MIVIHIVSVGRNYGTSSEGKYEGKIFLVLPEHIVEKLTKEFSRENFSE